MLRQVRICARPRALQWPTATPSQWRQFWGRQQQEIPPDVPVYFSNPPRSRGRRFKDMAIGSALTVGLYTLYQYFTIRKAFAQLKELEEELAEEEKLIQAIKDEFDHLFAEARKDGDHERLRELTFELTRRLFDKEKGDGVVFERGPLPGFPIGDDNYGKEEVPVEDTRMFVEETDGLIGGVQIAINMEFEQVQRDLTGRLVLDPKKNKLAELFLRFGNQVDLWKKMGRMHKDEDIFVIFQLRDEFTTFVYTRDGQFEPLDDSMQSLARRLG